MKRNEKGLRDLSPLAGLRSPGRDLWPEIAASIASGRKVRDSGFRPARYLLAAASLAAAMGLGIAAGSSSFFGDRGLPGYVRTVNADYRQAERETVYRLGISDLPEETVLEIKENFRIINLAADRLMELVRTDPENRLLSSRIYLINRERFEFLEAVRSLLRPDGGGNGGAGSKNLSI